MIFFIGLYFVILLVYAAWLVGLMLLRAGLVLAGLMAVAVLWVCSLCFKAVRG